MPSPMVPVATAASPFEARLIAARLGAEGFLWELRGNLDGPYPVGPVQVLVPEGDAAEVQALLAEGAPEPHEGPFPDDPDDADEPAGAPDPTDEEPGTRGRRRFSFRSRGSPRARRR